MSCQVGARVGFSVSPKGLQVTVTILHNREEHKSEIPVREFLKKSGLEFCLQLKPEAAKAFPAKEKPRKRARA